MKFLHDDLLSTVAQVSDRLGPVTKLIDGIVDRLVPKMMAQAATQTDCLNGNYPNFCHQHMCFHDKTCPSTGYAHSYWLWSTGPNCTGQVCWDDDGCNC